MRSAGILMPISSLPSPCGIGSLGQAARDFVDFLAAAGQSYWQILPICPTSYGDSPYQSFSSFAGNPYFIDLDTLADRGFLEPSDYRDINWGDDPAKVDYGRMYENRFSVLRRACSRMGRGDLFELRGVLPNARWLDDYALFMALKDKFGGASWFQWPEELRRRDPAALRAAKKELREEIRFWTTVQLLFFNQWWNLKEYANGKGVSIIGDLPIYVAGDSADVWANRTQFQLDENLLPTEVAGCPPDGFAADGQLWGNPLFDWERMREDGYQWWLERVAFQLEIYDVLRIDHFRGFESYYAIPYGEATAKNGRWRPGPGLDFFRAVHEKLGRQNIIAEDLGFLTDPVRELLRETGYPGMKVLELAFDSRDPAPGYLPHCYPANCVAYPGTHDNDTILGWLAHADPKDAAFAKAYLRLNRREGYHWGMIRAAWASPADLAVIQAQDLLGLGSEARMNTPSTLGGNWQWRALPGAFPPRLARRLRREMEEARAQAEQYRQRIEEERRKATEKAQAEARAILEQARDAADRTFKELNEMRRRQEQAKEWIDDNEERAQLRRKLNEADAALGGRKEELPPPPPTRDAVLGDTVELLKMGTQAEVVGVNKDGTLQLQAGILKLKAKQDEVRVLEDVTARKKQSAKDKARAAAVSRPFRAAAAKAELDLRGMMVDEAIGAVDLFLDNALMGKLETVTIIHGKGTGALRKAVREHLKKSRYVKEYRPGVYGEGEDGVTVATLR